EITLLKDQLRERDETVRNLQSEINISKMLKLGGNDNSTDSSINVQALEAELCQLKDTITSLRIENDALKSTTRISSKPDTAVNQPNVSVPLSTGVKPASRASKPKPKSNAWIYRRLSARSGRGEKVAA
nr:hypothetical protein [Tanacetum cinerariifolium]